MNRPEAYRILQADILRHQAMSRQELSELAGSTSSRYESGEDASEYLVESLVESADEPADTFTVTVTVDAIHSWQLERLERQVLICAR